MRGNSCRYGHAANGALVVVFLLGCGSGAASPTTSPTPVVQSTPTRARTATSATPLTAASASPVASPAASGSSGTSSIPASGSPGTVSIVGSNEIHEKQTESGGTETYDMVAHFTATAGAGNQMTGTSQLTGDYSVDSSCSWATGPLTWTATLDGTYELKPDGGLFLNLFATPATSQTVTLDFGCGTVAAPGPYSIPWPGGSV